MCECVWLMTAVVCVYMYVGRVRSMCVGVQGRWARGTFSAVIIYVKDCFFKSSISINIVINLNAFDDAPVYFLS